MPLYFAILLCACVHVEPKHTLDTLRGMLSSNKCSDNKTFINKMEARRRRRRRKEEGGGGVEEAHTHPQ